MPEAATKQKIEAKKVGEIGMTLSFEPRYHRWVELPGVAGWTLAVSPLFDPVRHAMEIVDEQGKIQRESGAIIVFDLKT